MAKRGVTSFLQSFHEVGITFFDIETDLLVVLDKLGNVERVNPACERILARAESEIVGKSFARFIYAGDLQEPHVEHLRLLRRDRGVVTVRAESWKFVSGRWFIVLRPVHQAIA